MEFRRLFDIPLYQLLHFPQKVALTVRAGIQKKSYSSQDCLDEIMKVSAGALNKGLGRGDKVAIVSRQSSPKWTFLDIGLQQIGIIPVPISPDFDDEILQELLLESEVRIVIVDDREDYERIQSFNGQLKAIKGIYTFEQLPDLPGWDNFIANPEPSHEEQYQASRAITHDDDIATIIYTSGTTGKPKGVVLSHKNTIANIKGLMEALPLKASHTVVSIMPQYQIFERMLVYSYLASGSKICFVKPSDSLIDDIQSIRPHYFAASPAMLKGFYEQLAQDAMKLPKQSKLWFLWSVRQGRKYSDYDKLSLFYFLKLRVADLFVFRKWRAAFGGRIEGIFMGKGAMSPSFAKMFTAAGIDVREGYGLAETASIISINRFEASQVNFGTAGKVLDGLEVKIEAPLDEFGNGEIYVKGDMVMKSYWKREEETYESLQYGWLRTGDLGRLTEKKSFLQIAGRKADMITLSSGESLNPVFVERKLLSSPFVGRCLVVGEGKPSAVALIVPFFANVKMYAKLKDISLDSNEETILHPEIKALFQKEIQTINQELSPRENISKFKLLEHPWILEKGEISISGGLKRAVILAKMENIISRLYDEDIS